MAGKNQVGFNNKNVSEKALPKCDAAPMNDKSAVSPTHAGPNIAPVKGAKCDAVVKGQDVGKRK